MVTILDVAKLAGASLGTVSNVINKTTYVSPKLTRRVLKAIRELNYHPNGMARSLRTRASKTVGMIIPNITDPFFPFVVRGAEDVLLDAGYQLIVGNSDDDASKEEAYYSTFRTKRVDGLLLIISPSAQAPDYLRRHGQGMVPIVLLDRYHPGLGNDVVALDDTEGSFQAVSHLCNSGHRNIAIITGPLTLLNARMRLGGYRRALERHGVPFVQELVYEGSFDIASGHELTKSLLKTPIRPTGLFVCNPQMTIGVLRAFRDHNIRCPQDMAVVSFGDMDLFELMRPSVSAVKLPVYDLGATAAEILLKRISGKLTSSAQRKVLAGELVVRESSSRGPGSEGRAASE